jgi:hypothetical protein
MVGRGIVAGTVQNTFVWLMAVVAKAPAANPIGLVFGLS